MSRLGRLYAGAGWTVLALDLLSKWWVESHFQLQETLPLLPGLSLTYVRNPGAAFSLFASWPEALRRPFFIAVTAFALWMIHRYFRRLKPGDGLSALALGLVLGGALGNLVDRLRYGQVVDFVEVGVRGVYTWPIFNLADSAISVGVGLLVWRAFFPAKEREACTPSSSNSVP